MLASITPLGERGRRQRWIVTVTAFLLAATAAGAAVGAALGGLGAMLLGGAGERARLFVLAAAAVLALALEVGGRRIPSPKRQVDRRWLDEFRGWVYGAGFGAQLGAGVVTVVTSATTYLALLAALLSGDPAAGAVILALYGAARGLQPLAAARVTDPQRLHAFHRRLDRLAPAVPRVSVAASAGILVAAVAGALA